MTTQKHRPGLSFSNEPLGLEIILLQQVETVGHAECTVQHGMSRSHGTQGLRYPR